MLSLIMLSLVSRDMYYSGDEKGVYIREYDGYDKPTFDFVCSFDYLGIKNLTEIKIKEIKFGDKRLKGLKYILVPNSDLGKALKICQNSNENLYIMLDFEKSRIYGDADTILILKLRGDLTK